MPELCRDGEAKLSPDVAIVHHRQKDQRGVECGLPAVNLNSTEEVSAVTCVHCLTQFGRSSKGDCVGASTFECVASEVGRLVTEKNKAYGSSFEKSGAIMRIFYPEGVSHTQLDDALTVIRVLDKLFRIATARDALGESPWRDVMGYALLAVERVEREKSS